MNEPDYAAMTYEQLKCHIVKRREDKAAFSAFLARRQKRNHPIIADVKNINFDDKFHNLNCSEFGKLSR